MNRRDALRARVHEAQRVLRWMLEQQLDERDVQAAWEMCLFRLEELKAVRLNT